MNSIERDFGLKIISENSFRTVYAMDKENSGSRMIAYRLYPGMEILLNDFRELYSWSGQWKEAKQVYQICYSHKGVYQAELSRNKLSYVSPGSIALLNGCKQSLGSRMTTEVLQGFNILIYPELLDEGVVRDWESQFDLDINSILGLLGKIKGTAVFPCGTGMLPVAEELYELLYNSELGIVRLKLLEFFHLILKEDFRIETVRRVFSREQIEKTKRIKELIEMDLSRHYTIQELCRDYGMSTTIFKECFKEIFQYPPYEFLRIARMNKAAEYLNRSDYSILDIGRLLGYENPSNFTRTFKEVYGVLPKEYRNRMDW